MKENGHDSKCGKLPSGLIMPGVSVCGVSCLLHRPITLRKLWPPRRYLHRGTFCYYTGPGAVYKKRKIGSWNNIYNILLNENTFITRSS
jgi:hypothetical protein